MTQEKIIRISKVMDMTGMKRSTIYHHIKNGTFPRPIRIAARSSGWIASEVNEWIESKIADSRLGETQ